MYTVNQNLYNKFELSIAFYLEFESPDGTHVHGTDRWSARCVWSHNKH